jgi:Spy/CpxP family protein refolding chaperone
LFGVGASAVGAAAAVAAFAPAVPSAPVPAAPRPMPEKGGGYHLSEHIRGYYQSTRI